MVEQRARSRSGHSICHRRSLRTLGRSAREVAHENVARAVDPLARACAPGSRGTALSGGDDRSRRAVPQVKTEEAEWFESWFGEDYVALYPHRNEAEAERVVALIAENVRDRDVGL